MHLAHSPLEVAAAEVDSSTDYRRGSKMVGVVEEVVVDMDHRSIDSCRNGTLEAAAVDAAGSRVLSVESLTA